MVPSHISNWQCSMLHWILAVMGRPVMTSVQPIGTGRYSICFIFIRDVCLVEECLVIMMRSHNPNLSSTQYVCEATYASGSAAKETSRRI